MYTTLKSKKLAENKFYSVCENYENELRKSAALRFAHIQEKFYNLATNKSTTKIKEIKNDLNNSNRRKEELLSFLMDSISCSNGDESSNGDENDIEADKNSSGYFSFNNSLPKTSLDICDGDHFDMIAEEDMNEDEHIPVSDIDKWFDYANVDKHKQSNRGSATHYTARIGDDAHTPFKNIVHTKSRPRKSSINKRKNLLKRKKIEKPQRGNTKLTFRAEAYKGSCEKTNEPKKMIQRNKKRTTRKNEGKVSQLNSEAEMTNLYVKRKSGKGKLSSLIGVKNRIRSVQKQASVSIKNSCKRKYSKIFANDCKKLKSVSTPSDPSDLECPLVPLPDECHSVENKHRVTRMMNKLQQRVGKRERPPGRKHKPSVLSTERKYSSMEHKQRETKGHTLRKNKNQKQSTLRELEPSFANFFTIEEDKSTVANHNLKENEQMKTSNRSQYESVKWIPSKNGYDLPRSSPYIKDMTDVTGSLFNYLILKDDLSVVVSSAKKRTSKIVYALPLNVKQEKYCCLSKNKEQCSSMMEFCAGSSTSPLLPTSFNLQNPEHVQVSSENASVSLEQQLPLTPVGLKDEQDEHSDIQKQKLAIDADNTLTKKAENSLLLTEPKSTESWTRLENDLPFVFPTESNLPLTNEKKSLDDKLDDTSPTVNPQNGSHHTKILCIEDDSIILHDQNKQEIVAKRTKDLDGHYTENDCYNNSIDICNEDNIFLHMRKQKTTLNQTEVDCHNTESHNLSHDDNEDDSLFLPKEKHSTTLNKASKYKTACRSVNSCESKLLDNLFENTIPSVRKADVPFQTESLDIEPSNIFLKENQNLVPVARELDVDDGDRSQSYNVVDDDALFLRRQKQIVASPQANEADGRCNESNICQKASYDVPKLRHSTSFNKSTKRNRDYTQSTNICEGNPIDDLLHDSFHSINKPDAPTRTQKLDIEYNNITLSEQNKKMATAIPKKLRFQITESSKCQSRLHDDISNILLPQREEQTAAMFQTKDSSYTDTTICQGESNDVDVEDDSIYLPKQSHSTTNIKTNEDNSNTWNSRFCQSKSVKRLSDKLHSVNNRDHSTIQILDIKYDSITMPEQMQEITVTRATEFDNHFNDRHYYPKSQVVIEDDTSLIKQKWATAMTQTNAKQIDEYQADDKMESEDECIFLPQQRRSSAVNKTHKVISDLTQSQSIGYKAPDILSDNKLLFAYNQDGSPQTQKLEQNEIKLRREKELNGCYTENDKFHSVDVGNEDNIFLGSEKKKTELNESEVEAHYTNIRISHSLSHDDIEDDSLFLPKQKHSTILNKVSKFKRACTRSANSCENKFLDNLTENIILSVKETNSSFQTESLNFQHDNIFSEETLVPVARELDVEDADRSQSNNAVDDDTLFIRRQKQIVASPQANEADGRCNESNFCQKASYDLPKLRHSTSFNKSTKRNRDYTQSTNICEGNPIDDLLHDSFHSVNKPDAPTRTQKLDTEYNNIALSELNKKMATAIPKKLRFQITESSKCQSKLHDEVNVDIPFPQRLGQTAAMFQAKDSSYTESTICQGESNDVDGEDDSIYLPKQSHSTNIKTNEDNSRFCQGKSVNRLPDKFHSVNNRDHSTIQILDIKYDSITMPEQMQEITVTRATELDNHYNDRHYYPKSQVVIEDDTSLIKQKWATAMTQTNAKQIDEYQADDKMESEDECIFLPQQRRSSAVNKTHKVISDLTQSQSIGHKAPDILSDNKLLFVYKQDGSPQTQRLEQQEIKLRREKELNGCYTENDKFHSVDVGNEDDIFLGSEKKKIELNESEVEAHYTDIRISHSLSHDDIEDDSLFLPKQKHSTILNKVSKFKRACTRSANSCESKFLDNLTENIILSVKETNSSFQTESLNFQHDNIFSEETLVPVARELDVEDADRSQSNNAVDDDTLFIRRQKQIVASPQANEADGRCNESNFCQKASYDLPKLRHSTSFNKSTKRNRDYTQSTNICEGNPIDDLLHDSFHSVNKPDAPTRTQKLDTEYNNIALSELNKKMATAIPKKLKFQITESSKCQSKLHDEVNVDIPFPQRLGQTAAMFQAKDSSYTESTICQGESNDVDGEDDIIYLPKQSHSTNIKINEDNSRFCQGKSVNRLPDKFHSVNNRDHSTIQILDIKYDSITMPEQMQEITVTRATELDNHFNDRHYYPKSQVVIEDDTSLIKQKWATAMTQTNAKQIDEYQADDKMESEDECIFLPQQRRSSAVNKTHKVISDLTQSQSIGYKAPDILSDNKLLFAYNQDGSPQTQKLEQHKIKLRREKELNGCYTENDKFHSVDVGNEDDIFLGSEKKKTELNESEVEAHYTDIRISHSLSHDDIEDDSLFLPKQKHFTILNKVSKFKRACARSANSCESKLLYNLTENTILSVKKTNSSFQTENLDFVHDNIFSEKNQTSGPVARELNVEDDDMSQRSNSVVDDDALFIRRQKQILASPQANEADGRSNENNICQKASYDVPKLRHSTSFNKSTKRNRDYTQSTNICEGNPIDDLLHDSFHSINEPDAPTQTQKLDIEYNNITLSEQNKKMATAIPKKLRFQITESSKCQSKLHDEVNVDIPFPQRLGQTAAMFQAKDSSYTESTICQGESNDVDGEDDSIYLPKQSHSTNIKTNEDNSRFCQGKSVNRLPDKFHSVNNRDHSTIQILDIKYDSITMPEQMQEIIVTRATELDSDCSGRHYYPRSQVIIEDDTSLIKQKWATAMTQTNAKQIDGYQADDQMESEDECIFLPQQRRSSAVNKTHKVISDLTQSQSIGHKAPDILSDNKLLFVYKQDGSPQTQRLEQQEIKLRREKELNGCYTENDKFHSVDVGNEDDIFLGSEKKKTELNKSEVEAHYTDIKISQSLSHDDIKDDSLFLPKQKHSTILNKVSKYKRACVRSTNFCESKLLDNLIENTILSVKETNSPFQTGSLNFQHDNIFLKETLVPIARELDVDDADRSQSYNVVDDDALFLRRQKQTVASTQAIEFDVCFAKNIFQSKSHKEHTEDDSIFLSKQRHIPTSIKKDKNHYTRCQGKVHTLQNKAKFMKNKSSNKLNYKKKYAAGVNKCLPISKDLHKDERTVFKSKLKHFQDQRLNSSMKNFTERPKVDKTATRKLSILEYEAPRPILKESNCNDKIVEYIKISNDLAAERLCGFDENRRRATQSSRDRRSTMKPPIAGYYCKKERALRNESSRNIKMLKRMLSP